MLRIPNPSSNPIPNPATPGEDAAFDDPESARLIAPDTTQVAASPARRSAECTSSGASDSRLLRLFWGSVLLYAFFGLPVVNRVILFRHNFLLFTPLSTIVGAVLGLLQDIAVFTQASAVMLVAKALWEPSSMRRRYCQKTRTKDLIMTADEQREALSHASMRVLVHAVDQLDDDDMDDDLEAPSLKVKEHRARLAKPSSHPVVSTYTCRQRVWDQCQCMLIVLQVIAMVLVLIVATVPSVADFCLQMTMHMRLNRAFVVIFLSNVSQFSNSLGDEDVMTPAVMIALSYYVVLLGVLLYGSIYDRMPLLPDLLQWASCSEPASTSRSDAESSGNRPANMLTSAPESRCERVMRVLTCGCIHRKHRSLVGVVLSCASVSLAVTLGTVGLSVALHSPRPVFSPPTERHSVLGLDVPLVANPMFLLQTEPLFSHKTRAGADHLNCKKASHELLEPLREYESYSTSGMDNDDSCALLWRKTTQFHGEKFLPINDRDGQSKPEKKVATPNFILINMESWRAMDMGVLGMAEKKARLNKTATPNFDRLSRDGVLFSNHISPCIQTTRTLLSTLYGMLPSCTEEPALKNLGPKMEVNGLPQFLKQHGYTNMFWSAVDLTWEFWDQFLAWHGFDKLVNEKAVRRMAHELRSFADSDNDHFSWGTHDKMSFEMLAHALEYAKNISLDQNSTTKSKTIANTNISEPQEAPLAWMKWDKFREPYFVDVYSVSSHNPWVLPSNYHVPNLTGLYTEHTKKYLNSVHFSDHQLGQFIDTLRARGLMKNTIVMIEGDHGYGRLEHVDNILPADSKVYEELMHVPFLLLADDFLAENERGMVVDQLTMHPDIMTTIADIIGISEDDPLYQHGVGQSMLRRQHKKNPKTGKDTDRKLPLCNPFNGMTQGVRTTDHKFSFESDGSYKVFDVTNDPFEQNAVQSGYGIGPMDPTTREMFDFVTHHVDLNQYIYESGKLSTPRD